MENLFQDEEQISPKFLNQLNKEIQINGNWERIVAVYLLIDITSILGWVEHTSDWDLGATIKLKNGKQIEIPQGYADSITLHDDKNKQLANNDLTWNPDNIESFTLQLTENNCDTDDEDVNPISIPIQDIKTIQIFE